jgi:hypothetical protein
LAFAASHVVQTSPAAPHDAAVVGVRQPPSLSQHPEAHEVESHTHALLTQR